MTINLSRPTSHTIANFSHSLSVVAVLSQCYLNAKLCNIIIKKRQHQFMFQFVYKTIFFMFILQYIDIHITEMVSTTLHWFGLVGDDEDLSDLGIE